MAYIAGNSGSKSFTMGTYFQVWVDWSETYDLELNKSIVSVRLYLYSDTYGEVWYPDGTITVDGSAVVEMDMTSPATHWTNGSIYNTWQEVVNQGSNGAPPPWSSGEISHNADGSKSVEIAINNLQLYRSDKGSLTLGSTSFTVELTTIPRASTIGATDANIGAVSMIAVNRNSSAFTHSIAYKFGNLSGYITADGGVAPMEQKISAASIAFTVPESFYTQIPAAKSGVCTLTCKTYSGDEQIGDAQTAQFTVTAAQSVSAPVVSGKVEDSNAATIALTGNAAKLVRFCSNALCTISATAKNSATISQKKIGGVAVSGNTRTIAGIEATAVDFAAVDSRGYETAVSVNYELVPYVHLTNNPSGKRTGATNGNAVLTVKGNYYNGSFGARINSLAVWYEVIKITDTGEERGEVIQAPATLSENTYSLEVALSGLDYRYAYRIEVTVQDALETQTKSAQIMPGDPVYYWNKRKFCFRVPVVLSEKNYGSAAPAGFQKGQTFFLQNSAGTYDMIMYNGAAWEYMLAGMTAIESTEYPGCYCRVVSGITEWINPPMNELEEYATTERYKGRRIYQKLVILGALPNAGTKYFDDIIPYEATDVISVEGYCYDEVNVRYVLPIIGSEAADSVWADFSTKQVGVKTIIDASVYTGYVFIKYLKGE